MPAISSDAIDYRQAIGKTLREKLMLVHQTLTEALALNLEERKQVIKRLYLQW